MEKSKLKGNSSKKFIPPQERDEKPFITNRDKGFVPGTNPNLQRMKKSQNRPKFKDIEIKPPVKQISYEQPVFNELVKAPVHMAVKDEVLLTFKLRDSLLDDATRMIYNVIATQLRAIGCLQQHHDNLLYHAVPTVIICAAAQIYSTLSPEEKQTIPEFRFLQDVQVDLPTQVVFFLHTLGSFRTDIGECRVYQGPQYVAQLILYAIGTLHTDLQTQNRLAPYANGLQDTTVIYRYFTSSGLFLDLKKDAAKRYFTLTRPPALTLNGNDHVVPSIGELVPNGQLNDMVIALTLHNNRIGHALTAYHTPDPAAADLAQINCAIQGWNISFKQMVTFAHNMVTEYTTVYGQSLGRVVKLSRYKPTQQGNACQLVKRQTDNSLQVQIPLTQTDMKIGFLFNYLDEITETGVFTGFVQTGKNANRARLTQLDLLTK